MLHSSKPVSCSCHSCSLLLFVVVVVVYMRESDVKLMVVDAACLVVDVL